MSLIQARGIEEETIQKGEEIRKLTVEGDGGGKGRCLISGGDRQMMDAGVILVRIREADVPVDRGACDHGEGLMGDRAVCLRRER